MELIIGFWIGCVFTLISVYFRSKEYKKKDLIKALIKEMKKEGTPLNYYMKKSQNNCDKF